MNELLLFVLSVSIPEEMLWQCTSCGACEYQCPVGIQHLPMIIGLRRGAVNTGKWEDDYGTKLFLNLERNGNAMGFAASERQKFIEAKTLQSSSLFKEQPRRGAIESIEQLEFMAKAE